MSQGFDISLPGFHEPEDLLPRHEVGNFTSQDFGVCLRGFRNPTFVSGDVRVQEFKAPGSGRESGRVLDVVETGGVRCCRIPSRLRTNGVNTNEDAAKSRLTGVPKRSLCQKKHSICNDPIGADPIGADPISADPIRPSATPFVPLPTPLVLTPFCPFPTIARLLFWAASRPTCRQDRHTYIYIYIYIYTYTYTYIYIYTYGRRDIDIYT